MNQNEQIQPTSPATPPIQPKSIPWLWIIFGIVVLAAAGFFVWNNAQKSKVATPVAPVSIPTKVTPKTTPSVIITPENTPTATETTPVTTVTTPASTAWKNPSADAIFSITQCTGTGDNIACTNNQKLTYQIPGDWFDKFLPGFTGGDYIANHQSCLDNLQNPADPAPSSTPSDCTIIRLGGMPYGSSAKTSQAQILDSTTPEKSVTKDNLVIRTYSDGIIWIGSKDTVYSTDKYQVGFSYYFIGSDTNKTQAISIANKIADTIN